MTKLYTKTGDNGSTGLIGGTRIHKNDIRIEAYGTIDELNSFIGVLSTYQMSPENVAFLRIIQNNLFSIGSQLATDRDKVELKNVSIISNEDILSIEHEIDRLDEFLPELTVFVLPGGGRAASFSHICRTISRRAERRIFDMKNLYVVDSQVLIYMNRLSDYFFVLSRYLNNADEEKEIYWKI